MCVDCSPPRQTALEVRNYRYQNKCFPLRSGVHVQSDVKSSEVHINRRKTYTLNDYTLPMEIFHWQFRAHICKQANWYRWQGPQNDILLPCSTYIAIEIALFLSFTHFVNGSSVFGRIELNACEMRFATKRSQFELTINRKMDGSSGTKEIHLIYI